MSRASPSTTTENAAGRSTRGGARTRRRILSAALRLFSRDGFHRTSIRTLARSVGLTEAAIYHHFQSKRAIVEALYEQRGFMTAMEELEHLTGTMPLEQQLAANALASARLWSDNADLLRVVTVEVLGGDKAAKIVHRGFMERWRKGILDLLSRYRTRGEIVGDVDVVEAADRWVNLMFGIFMDRLLMLGRSARRAGFLTPEFREYVEVTANLFGRRLREEPAARLDGRR